MYTHVNNIQIELNEHTQTINGIPIVGFVSFDIGMIFRITRIPLAMRGNNDGFALVLQNPILDHSDGEFSIGVLRFINSEARALIMEKVIIPAYDKARKELQNDLQTN